MVALFSSLPYESPVLLCGAAPGGSAAAGLGSDAALAPSWRWRCCWLRVERSIVAGSVATYALSILWVVRALSVCTHRLFVRSEGDV